MLCSVSTRPRHTAAVRSQVSESVAWTLSRKKHVDLILGCWKCSNLQRHAGPCCAARCPCKYPYLHPPNRLSLEHELRCVQLRSVGRPGACITSSQLCAERPVQSASGQALSWAPLDRSVRQQDAAQAGLAACKGQLPAGHLHSSSISITETSLDKLRVSSGLHLLLGNSIRQWGLHSTLGDHI